MNNISWHQLEQNSSSKELSFESFCFQIATKKYKDYGTFESYYNTPGSEFYMELSKDCDELNAKAGDIIGWQAKFWLNKKDKNNSSLDAGHRNELVQGLKKTLEYKKNLTQWIICTPGKFSNTNTKAGKPWDLLVKECNKLKNGVNLSHWHKDKFEAIFHSNPEEYSSIFNHYFNTKFIGIKLINDFSKGNLEYLESKFDVELYVPDEKEVSLLDSFDIIKGEAKIKDTLQYLTRKSIEIENSKIFNKDSLVDLPDSYTKQAKNFLKSHINFIQDIQNVVLAVKAPLLFIQTLHKKLVEFYDEKESERNSLNNLIGEIFHDQNKSQINYWKKDWHDSMIKYSLEIRNTLFNSKIDSSILNQCKRLIDNECHIFGGAANGKTNLVCSITNRQIQKRLPVLLLLGISFKNQVPPKANILQLLEISHDYTFTEFLGVLSNLANLKNTRIPIIIDGLNESSPTSGAVWNQEIYSLIREIKRFPNLALITSCRDKSEYIQQIFGKNTYVDIDNHIYLKGFTERNINVAIGKYFHKKDITVKSENYDKSLFYDPLRLKIFSEVNKGKKNIEISLHSIVNSVDKYLDEISANISKINGVKDRIIETRLRKGLLQVGILLWTKNTRDLKTFEEFRPLFDNDEAVWCDSLTFKIIDEGLCFQRSIEHEDEIIQFTIDLIGGYQIAKSTFFSECTTCDETVRKLDNQVTKDKLYGLNKSLRHPLSEDILIALSYLIQKKIGKQLFDYFPVNSVIIESIGNLELIGFNNEEKGKLVQFIKKNVYDIKTKSQIVQKLYIDVIQKKYFSVFDLSEDIFLSFSQYEIDSFWCELIRKDTFKLQELLKYISINQINHQTDKHNIFLFVLMLTASTDKKLRSEATKCLMNIGLMHPKYLLTMGYKFKLVNDKYIIESLICSLTGTILRLKNKEFTESVIKFLQEDFLICNRSNHIAILDYIQTIFEFGLSYYGIEYDKNIIYRNKDEVWDFNKELIKKDRDDFFWSYEMMDYDFIKFQIASLSKHSYGSISKYSRAEIISFIYERIKQNGYSKDLYTPIEEKIAEDNKYRREEASERVIKYGEKYLYSTYLELAGFLMLNDQIKPEYRNTLRFSYIFFDPTFPVIKNRTQISNDCFLPAFNEDIQNWVIKDPLDLLKKLYITIPNFEISEMILLYASLNQKDEDNNTFITLSISTYIFDLELKKNILETFQSRYINRSEQLNQIFGCEIPWRNHIESDEEIEYVDDEDGFEYEVEDRFDDISLSSDETNHEEIKILSSDKYYPLVNTYSWSSWSSDRYQNPNFVFLDSLIAIKMELDFKIEELSHIDRNGNSITKHYKTDNSEFLFIERKALEKYLKENNCDLIWNKFIAKYGEFGIHQNKKLDPSYKDFKSIDFYSDFTM